MGVKMEDMVTHFGGQVVALKRAIGVRSRGLVDSPQAQQALADLDAQLSSLEKDMDALAAFVEQERDEVNTLLHPRFSVPAGRLVSQVDRFLSAGARTRAPGGGERTARLCKSYAAAPPHEITTRKSLKGRQR